MSYLDLRALPFDRNLPELIPSLHFRHFPESCALIIIGLLVGVIVYYGNQDHSHHFPSFTASLFFNVLLPPIILGNIAVNVFAIGFGLYGLSCIGAMGSFNFLDSNGTEQVFIPTIMSLPCKLHDLKV